MKTTLLVLSLGLLATPVFAQKACEELKSEIAAKLDAKGVKNYQLDILTTDDVKSQQVVGSCEHGSRKIIYSKS